MTFRTLIRISNNDSVPPTVKQFRSHVRKSAGVIISSPEYAHGVSGVLKNALDWLVASGDLYDKPGALFSTSSRATYAQASLTETLKVMASRLISEALITIPVLGRNLSEDSIVSDPDLSRMIRSALAAFVSAIHAGSHTHPFDLGPMDS